MKLTRFRTKNGLWALASTFAFLLCWLYPMHWKDGAYPLGKLWLDFVRGAYDVWLALTLLSLAFGVVSALIGFAVQALVSVLDGRIAQPGSSPNGGPAPPSGNSGVAERPPSVI